MSSVNKVVLIGNVGKDPDIRTTQGGSKIASFSLATSESWKDKSGERQSRSEWHKIVIFNDALVSVAERFIKKGSKIYIEGQLTTRKWQSDDGRDNYSTEIVLKPYKGEIVLLDGKPDGNDKLGELEQKQAANARNLAAQAPLDDDIPF